MGILKGDILQRDSRELLKKEITIIAYAGEESANSPIQNVVNDYLSSNKIDAHLIGISIKEDDFDFFIKNLKNSKVEVTIFSQEFQKKAAKAFSLEGFLIAAFKNRENFILVAEKEAIMMDDRKLIEIIEKIMRERDGKV